MMYDDEKREKAKLQEATGKFVGLMYNKLHKKVEQNWCGWDWEIKLPVLKRKLKAHVKKGYDNENLIDIANFCMMIYLLQAKGK